VGGSKIGRKRGRDYYNVQSIIEYEGVMCVCLSKKKKIKRADKKLFGKKRVSLLLLSLLLGFW
jgi:hypothetical protein